MSSFRTVSHKQLEKFVSEIFRSVGFALPDSDLIARSLVEADLRGVESHGVMRVPIYVKRINSGLVKLHSKGEVVRDAAATATIDGGNGMGQLMAYQGMQLAIEKANQYGIGIVGVKHSNHFGTAAFYSNMAAEQGMVGLSFTNTLPIMPAPGGSQALVGNNPLSIAIPTAAYRHVILDMAMSVAAVGKVMMALRKGESIPAGWAFDSEGNVTTDPQKALEAGLYMPIGGPKGFGLAFAIDVLCGALLDSAVGNEVKSMTFQWTDPVDCGHLMIAINIESFTRLQTFQRKVDQMIDAIKHSRANNDTGMSLYPGEPEHLREQERRENGIPLSAKVFKELTQVAADLGVSTSEITS